MIHLALSTAERDRFEAALVESHRIRITITILDRNEKPLGSLAAPMVLSGAVQVDAKADVTRSLELVCLDPNNKLHFGADNPADQALFADNFIAVEYGVEVDNGWVDVPVFWGALTNFERHGPEVTIEAQGKESLAQDPALVVTGYTIPKGASVQKAIRNVMGRVGETRFALGSLPGRLHKHRSVIEQEAPWQVIVGGSQDANGNPKPSLVSKAGGHRFVFFDGRGRLTAKRKPGGAIWTFDRTMIVTQPGYTYDITTFRNHVEVKGGTPKHSKRHFRGHATLTGADPLSPGALGRHGHPRYLTTFFESDSLKSDAACRSKARDILNSIKDQSVTATFDTLPIPHLEEFDTVTIQWDGFSVRMPLTTWTLPLTADTPMSVGFNRPASRIKRRHGKKKKNK